MLRYKCGLCDKKVSRDISSLNCFLLGSNVGMCCCQTSENDSVACNERKEKDIFKNKRV